MCQPPGGLFELIKDNLVEDGGSLTSKHFYVASNYQGGVRLCLCLPAKQREILSQGGEAERKTETEMLRWRNVDIVTCLNIVSSNRAFVSLDPQKILCIILDASQKAIQIEREEEILVCET